MKHWYYFVILCSAAFFPLLFSFHKAIGFRPRLKNSFVAITIVAAVFVLWDVLFTGYGVWGFNAKYHIGLVFLSLPVEEILFFFIIPFCCVFTYHSLGRSIPVSPVYVIISVALAVFLAGFAFLCRERLYTCVASLLTAFVFVFAAWKKPPYLGQFFLAYAVLLVPFVLVNGALTGTFTREPVVFYNPDEITGVRVLTIPIEDFIYSAALIFANVAVFEWLENRSEKANMEATVPL